MWVETVDGLTFPWVGTSCRRSFAAVAFARLHICIVSLRRRSLILSVLLGFFAGTACATWTQDYETADQASSAGLTEVRPAAADAIERDCSVARHGKCSLRTKVRIDDAYITSGAHRAESDTAANKALRYSAGDRFKYRFSLMLASGWQFDDRADIDIVWQFKRTSSKPDAFVAVKGRELVLRVTDSASVVLLNPVPTGHWIDIELEILWSLGSQGQIQASVAVPGLAAPRLVTHSGPNLRDGRRGEGYLKWGLYKPGQIGRADRGRESLVWHDQISVQRMTVP